MPESKVQCPECRGENPESLKFCGECGTPLSRVCLRCRAANPPRFKFCGECGQPLEEAAPVADRAPETSAGRKHATVLFSDLSGYTALSERLDPEEVKEIMGRVFGEIAQIVARYEGFIEKFIGDAVMVLFGVPVSHEDDPVRAIKAAREIHEVVAALNPATEGKIGLQLRMHSGINTGLVVTGALAADRNRPVVTGDTINVASRLTGLAGAGEIVVGPLTHALAERFFHFEALAPVMVKGKAEPIVAHRVVAARSQPRMTRRSQGRRARLIGREAELEMLCAAAADLLGGRGAAIGISGEAGTGKSRLLEELRATHDDGRYQWLEGCSYAYTRNTPFFLVRDFFGRRFGIEEGDTAAAVRRKVEAGLEGGGTAAALPCVGSLFPAAFPQPEQFRPEPWQERFQRAILDVVSFWAAGGPLILCCEDLHWADPSSLALLRFLVDGMKPPLLFLHTFRTPFSLFTGMRPGGAAKVQELPLQELSPRLSQQLVESLLESGEVPPDLRTFVQDRAEGNPFYLEEVVNSLLETGSLVREGAVWRLTEGFREAEVSPTIHGIVSARIDRLEPESRRLLQEASVIGRTFPIELLGKVAGRNGRLRPLLDELERLDLLRVHAANAEPEYAFKHALTQEVVYRSLLRSERQSLHEKTGLAIEELYPTRIPELCETLAHHFAHGLSRSKAVAYLMQSGGKSHRRHALNEAHQYYLAGHDLLSERGERTGEEQSLLANLLLAWSDVFVSRADFKGLQHMLESSREFMESQTEEGILGRYSAKVGLCQAMSGQFVSAEARLLQALALCERTGDPHAIGKVCNVLCYTLWELGHLREAMALGERAVKLSHSVPENLFFFIHSHVDLAKPYNTAGEREKILALAASLRVYGESRGEPVAVTASYYCTGVAQLIAGEAEAACASLRLGLQSVFEPFARESNRLWLCFALLLSGRLEEAEEMARETRRICGELNFTPMLAIAGGVLAMVLAAEGRFGESRALLEEGLEASRREGRVIGVLQCEYYLGKVRALADDEPGALAAAEGHLRAAIEGGRAIEAHGFLGGPLFDLGALCRRQGRRREAAEYLGEALALHERCGAAAAARETRVVLAALEREAVSGGA